MCHLPLDPTLGGAKVYIENAAAMRELGVTVDLIGPETYATEVLIYKDENYRIEAFAPLIKNYIQTNGSSYDVIEYENTYLPYKRSEIEYNGILVCRSVLLVNHFDKLRLPTNSFKAKLKNIYYSLTGKVPYQRRQELSLICLNHADIINVPNNLDREKIISLGVDPEKIITAPYGYFSEKLNSMPLLDNFNSKEVSFIGSFDPRKGSIEFPKIISKVVEMNPEVIFNLLGCKGRHTSEEQILSLFPKSIHKNINIKMHFDPAELCDLLKKTSIGIFPSHLESFGFGLLELMLRGIPTVGYDVPGPSDLLIADLKTKRGDWQAIVERICRLISDQSFYHNCRLTSIQHIREFSWRNSAELQLNSYTKYKENFK
tara:strand:+ start:45697 stop:46815 length:1119 start_codon:yes stop_codon:yes gene_type:complete